MTKLDDWKRREALSDAEAAKRAGISRGYFTKLRLGTEVPSPELMLKFERIGACDWADWHGVAIAKYPEAKDHAAVNESADVTGLHQTNTNCGAAS
jgi:transcriptional regulator with XRE-family HTH domain